jgi:hypothetical protein
MVCPSRTAEHPLTANQKDHLQLMLQKGALGEEHAQTIYELRRGGALPNTMVIGALCDKGLAGKKARTRKGQRATIYWLTHDGIRRARDLAKGGRRV